MSTIDLPENSERARLRWVTDTELGITWDDGHQSVFTLAYLRRTCPCARCQVSPKDAEGQLMLPGAEAIRAQAVDPVGRYGIRFIWSDRHQTGIYTYDTLRQHCPCAECRTERRP